MLKVYNTLGRKLQEFKPINPSEVTFYHCGPTVYWTQQIGNMRAMVMADLIRRSITYLGYSVKFVRNYTDFGHLTGDNIGDADIGEDRMDKASRREGLTPQVIADKYIKEFEDDTKALNVWEPDIRARATDYLEGMIKMVQELLDKGFAYSTSKAIYFDVSKFPNYTKLSGRKLENDIAGAGVGEIQDPDKRNPADFAVWIFRTGPHANALQHWPSPFESPEVENGDGFPGWHIECSVMAKENLGESLDIHMGGVEHISIHHTNEIAQSEAVSGKKYVNYWIHNEHLLVDGKKMGKSEGNSYVLKNITEKGYDPIHLRYFFLQAHYRSKQNFTWEALESSKVAYRRLLDTLQSWGSLVGVASEEYKTKFVAALEDDFNIPAAVATMWDVTKSDLPEEVKLATILDFDNVLGLDLADKLNAKEELSSEVQELIDKRDLARSEKNWEIADRMRQELEGQGFEVLDTPDGTKVKKK